MPNRRPYNLNGLNLGWWLSLPSRNQKIDDICTCMSKIRLMIYIYILYTYTYMGTLLGAHVLGLYPNIPQHSNTERHQDCRQRGIHQHDLSFFWIQGGEAADGFGTSRFTGSDFCGTCGDFVVGWRPTRSNLKGATKATDLPKVEGLEKLYIH